jgi:CheY-like chemotaxis protein
MREGTKKILVVEDNLADVRLIREALRIQGIVAEIEHYETAEAGIRAICKYDKSSRNLPDLVLLDYNLPAGYARDVLQAITENVAFADVRRAVITCSVAPKDREQALSSGANLFIFKPANLDEFLNEVGTAIAGLLSFKSEFGR